jgi:hypothetical protein
VDDYLDFATNRSLPDLSVELQSALETLWSMAVAAGSGKMAAALTRIARASVGLISKRKLSLGDFFVIQAHGFMDENTFDIKRLMKCCVHELLPDGRAVPFCAYNNLGYRQQVKLSQEALP